MRFLKNNKGFSLAEIMIVVIIMGILTAVAVPVYTGISKNRKIDDCFTNRVAISAVVQEAMNGTLDNGKKQDVIRMGLAAHKDISPDWFPEGYKSVDCFKLTYEEKYAFTIGDIRGGYRPKGVKNYEIGCERGNYLKREDLEDVEFYTFLSNSEIPKCAFETDSEKYSYYIFPDATVLCSCRECIEALDD